MKWKLKNGKETEISRVRFSEKRHFGAWLVNSDYDAFCSREARDLLFEADGGEFALEIYRDGEGQWKPNAVIHKRRGSFCFACEGASRVQDSACAGFEEKLGAFYGALLRHPAVRIKAAISLKKGASPKKNALRWRC